ncbi:pyridoxamine 5'-phosphate oxidase family protein [Candidatus Bathyarchaeota archaeon]|nr:MAG: pyridoxamine 5'-phosphate oxidase family protein [Candidatus Bathyarchaeota archaeon]
MRPVLTDREMSLILSRDVCRLSTISLNRRPHVVPVGYVYLRGKFYIPTDRRAKKVRNLVKNSNATIVVDDERLERGVMIECTSKILEGNKAQPLREYMRNVKHWQNDETTAIIELNPSRKASWFLK